jgi:hypothetical protein
MGPIGLWAECSWEQDRGFTGLAAFTATSTTALILVMDTAVHCRDAGTSSSITFTQTRRGMGAAMSALPAMMAAVNTRYRVIGVETMVGDATKVR